MDSRRCPDLPGTNLDVWRNPLSDEKDREGARTRPGKSHTDSAEEDKVKPLNYASLLDGASLPLDLYPPGCVMTPSLPSAL